MKDETIKDSILARVNFPEDIRRLDLPALNGEKLLKRYPNVVAIWLPRWGPWN